MYNFLKLLSKIVMFFLRTEIRGRENLNVPGNTIIISNHLQLLDPAMIIAFFKQKVHFIAKEELFKTAFLRMILKHIGTFPVRRGMSDIRAVRNCLEVLRANGVLGIFLEGKRSRTGEVLPFEPGVAMFAMKTGATVIPVMIHHRYSLLKRPHMTVGAPLDMSRFEGMKRGAQTYDQVTQYMRECLLKLKEQPWEDREHARTSC